MPITTCIFDAYGTLFDVASAARELAEQPAQAGVEGCFAHKLVRQNDIHCFDREEVIAKQGKA